MKTLLLMRHAKSSWKFPELPDHDRPLNKRGQHDAPMMGHLLVDRELIPQRILCSSAERARQTAEAVVEAAAAEIRANVEIIFQDRLYMAEADGYIEALREQPDEIERVMVIGHNPGLETLLQILSGRIESLPTAVIAHLSLPIEHWSQINSSTTGELIDLWRPKELREEEADLSSPEKSSKAKASKGKKPKSEKDKDKSRRKDKAKKK